MKSYDELNDTVITKYKPQEVIEESLEENLSSVLDSIELYGFQS